MDYATYIAGLPRVLSGAGAIFRDAQDRINGADDYARQVLGQLRDQLSRHLSTIEKGLTALDSRE